MVNGKWVFNILRNIKLFKASDLVINETIRFVNSYNEVCKGPKTSFKVHLGPFIEDKFRTNESRSIFKWLNIHYEETLQKNKIFPSSIG